MHSSCQKLCELAVCCTCMQGDGAAALWLQLAVYMSCVGHASASKAPHVRIKALAGLSWPGCLAARVLAGQSCPQHTCVPHSCHSTEQRSSNLWQPCFTEAAVCASDATQCTRPESETGQPTYFPAATRASRSSCTAGNNVHVPWCHASLPYLVPCLVGRAGTRYGTSLECSKTIPGAHHSGMPYMMPGQALHCPGTHVTGTGESQRV